MKLNRTELKKILYDFNSISNRLMQADFGDYNVVLSRFMDYVRKAEIISDFINDCGPCTQDMADEFKGILGSYGRSIFSLGDTDEEEVRNIYAILGYIVDHNIRVYHTLTMGYTSSNKYQDHIKAFNNRVVMVLIRHIETYLTKVGIDMGLDDKATYNITVHNGQVNLANDNATIAAVNNGGFDSNQLKALIENVRIAGKELPPDEAEILSDSLDTIEIETVAETPKKGLLRTAFNGLKAIKGTVEFGAAVATLGHGRKLCVSRIRQSQEFTMGQGGIRGIP